MSCYGKNYYKAPDCPGCGQKDEGNYTGARMSSTAWGHDVSCCSEECGLKVAETLRRNLDSKEYKEAMEAYHKAKQDTMDAKYKDIPSRGFRDSFN